MKYLYDIREMSRLNIRCPVIRDSNCVFFWTHCKTAFPEVYSVIMCNAIFIIHASNIFILTICMLTQPG